MSKTICPICHNSMNVREGSKNVMIIDGIVAHRKCPKPKMSEQEAYEYKLLTNKIKFYITTKPSKDCARTGYNWANITNKIKQLKDQGFTYMDMLYALDEVVKLQGCFFGFGAVVNNIERIMYRKGIEDKIEIKKHEVEVFDLKVVEDKIDW